MCTNEICQGLGAIGHRDAFSSSSERRKHRAFRQACSAGHRASSEARGDVCSLMVWWWILRSSGVKTSPLRGKFDQLLLASSEGCGLHLRMIVTSNILVKKKMKIVPISLLVKKIKVVPIILLISLLVKKKNNKNSHPPNKLTCEKKNNKNSPNHPSPRTEVPQLQ